MEIFLQHCQAAVATHGSVMMALLLGGLVGSVSHCAGMCGPFVFAQAAGGDTGNQGLLARVRGAALLPYHFGRITTYIALGAAAAGLAGKLSFGGADAVLPALLLSLAGAIFLVSAVPTLRGAVTPTWLRGRLRGVGIALGRAAGPLMARPSGIHRYGLGLLLGFMPCGLVAAALMAAAATGNALAAMLGMAAFGLGTLPALVVVGGLAQVGKARWRRRMAPLAGGVMLFNSVSLFALAGGIIS